MLTSPTATEDVLTQLCHDLALLREQAGGPSVRRLAAMVGLGKSQVGAILAGHIRRPPDWRVVRSMVEAFYKYAHDHGHEQRLSIRSGLDEYWRLRYAVLEHAFSRAARDSPPPVAGAGKRVPRQLPPAAPHFVGRTAELAALSTAADRSSGVSGPLLITGMAGVGKTTLAVAWAHSAVRLFPDGQLYLNLRGFDPGGLAMAPEQALRALLEGLAVPPAAIPSGFEAQVGLYRSLLSDRRMLVVLDNARDAAQIRDLLPGTPASRALVTSRVDLAGLVAGDGAYPLALAVLAKRDARQLLSHRLGADRIAAEPAAVDRLIALSGRLPMALAILGAQGATRPEFPLSAIAEQTDRARDGLGAFHLGDDSIDMRAVFSWSYRALSAPAARLFRLLGLHPGPEVGVAAAASLAGSTEAAVSLPLAELTRANLIGETRPGRYGLHDLMRAYAIELAGLVDSEADRDAARRRMYDHYLQSAYAAAMRLNPQRMPIAIEAAGPGVTPEPLAHRDAAFDWFARERTVILSTVEQAGEFGWDFYTWALGWCVADFLELRGLFEEWIAAQLLVVAATRRLPDPLTLVRSLQIIGHAYTRAGRLDEALPALREALARSEELAEPIWQARTLNSLGGVLEGQGRYEEALDCARQSLALYVAAGHREGEARGHNSIGWLYSRLGRYRQAIEHGRQALARYQEMDDPNGQAAAWDSLGYAHHCQTEYGPAEACYQRALDLVRALGDRLNEAGTLIRLGDTQHAAGQVARAYGSWWPALSILDELGLPADPVRERLRGAEGP